MTNQSVSPAKLNQLNHRSLTQTYRGLICLRAQNKHRVVGGRSGSSCRRGRQGASSLRPLGTFHRPRWKAPGHYGGIGHSDNFVRHNDSSGEKQGRRHAPPRCMHFCLCARQDYGDGKPDRSQHQKHNHRCTSAAYLLPNVWKERGPTGWGPSLAGPAVIE